MATPDDNPASPSDEPMNCMEVWGGCGPTNSHFVRPGLDVWIWSQTSHCAGACGSDLRLMSSCASGRITRMLLADVCGYGPVLDEISRELRDLVKRNVNSIAHLRLVQQLSHRLEELSPRGGFASTMIGSYFAPTRSFSLCNAGHPPPLLFRCQTSEWSILKHPPATSAATGSLPGVIDPTEYQEFKIRLDVGDMLLSYSNSVTECRDAQGRTIGLHGILDRVRRLQPDAAQGLPATFIQQLRGEHSANLAEDDATVLLCEATDTPVPWRDNILAPLRLFRSVSDKTKLR